MTKNFSNGQRRTKARFPKVRTGCLTCKSRKVKCDEAKPVCQRCVKNDLDCRGYAPPKAWIFDPHRASNRPEKSSYDYASSEYLEINDCLKCCTAEDRSPRAQRSLPSEPHDFDTSYADYDTSLPHSYRTPQGSQPLLPYALSEDYHHLQYYLEKVEPSISSVTPYQDFWGVIVPQIAWHDGAVRHLIAAMSVAHREVVACPVVSPAGEKRLVKRCNLAIHDWSMQCNTQNSMSSALVLSRILSLINYTSGDFELSKIHRRHGLRIARQTLADQDSDITNRTLAETILQMNLCGPGFLADEDPVIKMVDETRLRQLSGQQQISLKHLKGIRHDFEDWMFATPKHRWLRLPTETRHVILVTWGLMNRTIGSLFDPDKAPAEAGTVFGHIFETRIKRVQLSKFHTGADKDGWLEVGDVDREASLHASFKELMVEIDSYVPSGSQRQLDRIMDTTAEIQRLTDAFLFQASDILSFSPEHTSPVAGVD